MNPSEFKASRDANLTAFQTKYDQLKSEYTDAMRQAKSETDRAKQCVHIQKALDTNKQMSVLVDGFLKLVSEGGCNLSPADVDKIRADSEKLKTQHSALKDGRDKTASLESVHSDLTSKIEHVTGVNQFYLLLLGVGMLILVVLIIYSGVRRAFNAKPVAPILPGGLAESRYF